MSETVDSQSILSKRRTIVWLPIEKLTISEFNTRCAWVDWPHVESLAPVIQEQGFHLHCPLLVNVVQNAAGEEIAWRVVAGRHRLEAAKRLGISEVPCLLYYGLTDQEECLLDRWDNEKDERHKRVHFLPEAEHYRYLAEQKGWSQREIARLKGVSRATVQWKLQIAALPEEVKILLREGGHHGVHLAERHLREILKLKNPTHILSICKDILSGVQSGVQSEEEDPSWPTPVMQQKDVERRVAELAALEERGEIAPEVQALNSPNDREKEPCADIDDPREEDNDSDQDESTEDCDDTPDPEGLAELRKFRQQVQEAEVETLESFEESTESRSWSTADMAFDVLPRWLKFSSLQRDFKSLWPLLQTLIGYALRFRAGDQPPGTGDFFLGDPDATPQELELFLAQATGVGSRTVRRKLRQLEEAGFLRIRPQKRGRAPHFQVKWDRLKRVYAKEAVGIPFREGGLKDLPEGFTGSIHPTPVHEIWFRQGRRFRGVDHCQIEVRLQLAQPPLQFNATKIQQLLQDYDVEHVALRLKELPLHLERYARQHRDIKNLQGFFLQSLATSFKI